MGPKEIPPGVPRWKRGKGRCSISTCPPPFFILPPHRSLSWFPNTKVHKPHSLSCLSWWLGNSQNAGTAGWRLTPSLMALEPHRKNVPHSFLEFFSLLIPIQVRTQDADPSCLTWGPGLWTHLNLGITCAKDVLCKDGIIYCIGAGGAAGGRLP